MLFESFMTLETTLVYEILKSEEPEQRKIGADFIKHLVANNIDVEWCYVYRPDFTTSEMIKLINSTEKHNWWLFSEYQIMYPRLDWCLIRKETWYTGTLTILEETREKTVFEALLRRFRMNDWSLDDRYIRVHDACSQFLVNEWEEFLYEIDQKFIDLHKSYMTEWEYKVIKMLHHRTYKLGHEGLAGIFTFTKRNLEMFYDEYVTN